MILFQYSLKALKHRIYIYPITNVNIYDTVIGVIIGT